NGYSNEVTVLLYYPGAENKNPLGETKKLNWSKLGPSSMSKEGTIDVRQWACGRTVASGSVSKQNEHIPYLLERSEFDIIAVPTRTRQLWWHANDKTKGKGGEEGNTT
ncbi:hypothetical protein THAOC_26958, partial [Thalassiosira oceanica]